MIEQNPPPNCSDGLRRYCNKHHKGRAADLFPVYPRRRSGFVLPELLSREAEALNGSLRRRSGVQKARHDGNALTVSETLAGVPYTVSL
jgi:hypothetical protein